MQISPFSPNVNISGKILPFYGTKQINFPSVKSDTEVIEEIIQNAKYMSERGLTAGSGGNISVRNGNKIFITTAGSKFCNLTRDDICQVNLYGSPLKIAPGKKPSSELPLHLEVYRQRKDVNSVIHFHPIYTSIYAVANRTPIKSILPHTTKHFNDLKVAKYENAGSPDLAINTAKTLGQSEAVIMGNHGALAVGKDLPIAVKTADSLENYSQISYLLEKSSFPITKLNNAQVAYMTQHIKSKTSAPNHRQLQRFISKSKTFIPVLEEKNIKKVHLVEKFLKHPNEVEVKKVAVSANGTVYMISDGKNKIAIKMRHLTQNDGSGIIKRQNPDFDTELTAQKQLLDNDIHIARYIGEIKDEKGTLALVFDYIDGKPLNPKTNYLTSGSLKTLYSDLFKLDKLKLFHRDLSLGNILQSDDGLCIIDFGAAKNYGQLKELSDTNTKYVIPDFMYPSNLENFEFLAFLTYLRQLSNSEEQGAKKATMLFKKHLAMKSDYHKKRVEMLSASDFENKSEMIKNEKILANAFELFAQTKDENIIHAIKSIEILRLKALNSQKMTRLFFENNVKNFATGIYWNYQEGFQIKALHNAAKKYLKQFKGNKTLTDYFNLQMKLADFHYKKIYTPTIKNNTEIINKALNENEAENITPVIENGNLLATKDIHGNWFGPFDVVYNGNKTSKGEF